MLSLGAAALLAELLALTLVVWLVPAAAEIFSRPTLFRSAPVAAPVEPAAVVVALDSTGARVASAADTQAVLEHYRWRQEERKHGWSASLIGYGTPLRDVPRTAAFCAYCGSGRDNTPDRCESCGAPHRVQTRRMVTC